MEKNCMLKALFLLTLINITKGQYFDILQGLQQLFQQPYPGNAYVPQYNGNTRNPNTHRHTNRHENRKKTNEQRNPNYERSTKKPAVNEYDYVFATTQKPGRKTTKHISSQYSSNVRNITDRTQSNIFVGDYFNNYDTTTKFKVNTKTTTEVNNYNNVYDKGNDVNRRTTENVLKNFHVNNNNRPVTENVFENPNHRENYAVNYEPSNAYNTNNNRNFNNNFKNNAASNVYSNSYSRDPNRRGFSNNDQNNNRPNNDRGILNTDYDVDVPKNTRNPNVYGINPNGNSRGNSNNNHFGGNNGFISTDSANNFGNTGTSNRRRPNDNYDRVTSNNFGNTNSYGTTASNNGIYPNNYNDRGNSNNFGSNRPNLNSDNPLINRPGVRPAPVDVGQPPITNRPPSAGNNFLVFNRPTDTSSITFMDTPDAEPEILLGPDEDEMTERQKRRYFDMAERMCDNYKALMVKKVVALPLVPSPDPVELNVTDCTPINVPLVIGGKVASIREFPHMALVGWMKIRTTGYSWKCGGSLISDRFVLTAGHCTYQDKDYDVVSGPPQAVQLGSSYLDDPGAVVAKVLAVIRHPKYKARRSYHDVALIKMVSKVTFSEVIRPACLGEPPPEGQNIIATGWGRTEFGGDHSEELRSVSLPVWNMEECREIWGTSLKLPNGVSPESHVCAGEKRGGKDTCQGDSGGPAQVRSGCAWRVVAVTSLGRSCGAPHTPALYALIPRALVAAVVFDNYTY